MADPTRCLFCDHALDGRSTKFCTTCLPPLGEWDDYRSYQRRYQKLLNAYRTSRRTPAPRRSRSVQGPLHGPPRPAHNKYTPEQAEAAIQAEADRLFPPIPTKQVGFLVYEHPLKTPPETPRLSTETGGSSEPLCAACLRPFKRVAARGTRYSYCPACARAISSHNNYPHLHPPLTYADRPCRCCGVIMAVDRATTFCSDFCRTMQRYKSDRCDLTPCETCGLMCRPFKQAQLQSLCNRCRFVKRARRRNKTQARRLAVEKAGDDITWRELGERDGWRCHLCTGRVLNKAGTAKTPKGATVDHLIPVADGGTHTWDNVALAHRSCNTSRGSAGDVQLRLVG